jgi:hypothetical protein
MTPPPDNSDPRDYVLDLSNIAAASVPAGTSEVRTQDSSPSVNYLSIYFKCCGVYAPIYKNKTATAYAGHCPRCRRSATIAISPTGSPSRIFQAE